ncbi:MAG: peptidoglycan-binding protein [Candidatus Sericytochromatia bacterium]
MNPEAQALDACREAETCLGKAFDCRTLNQPLARQYVLRALALYDSALELGPELPDAFLGLAYIAFCAGHFDEAFRLLSTAGELSSGDLRVVHLKSQIEHGLAAQKLKQQAPASQPATLAPLARLRDQIKPLTTQVPVSELSIELAFPDFKLNLSQDPPGDSGQAEAGPDSGLQALADFPEFPDLKAQLLEADAPGRPEHLLEGPELTKLQHMLQTLGFRLALTDAPAPATVQAIRQFQNQHKLSGTGRVDDKTRTALNQSYLDRVREKTIFSWCSARILAERQQQSLNCGELYRLYLEQQLQLIRKQARSTPVGASCANLAAQLSGLPGPWAQVMTDYLQHVNPQIPKPALEKIRSCLLDLLGASPPVIGGEPAPGKAGPEVRLLQALLLELGYPFEPSGQYDLPTAQALKAFQRAHKLAPSGLLDTRTRQALNQLLQKATG